MEKLEKLVRARLQQKPNARIHSDIHALADEISASFGERAKFAMYLGVIKRIGVARARAIYADIKSSDVREPGKLFFWRSRKPPQ